MKAIVRYPEDVDIYRDALGTPTVETLEADVLVQELDGGRTVELREHASFIPLGPGDIVHVDITDTVTGVEMLARVYTYEVDFHMPAPGSEEKGKAAVAALVEEWRRDAWITQDTAFSCHVTSQTHQWLEERVLSHPYVQSSLQLRTPEMRFDLATAVRHPDLNGDGGGPWA